MRVQIKRIMCATDFSDFSNLSLPYGMALAGEFEAKLFVCHIVDISSAAMYGEAMVDITQQQQRMVQYARIPAQSLIGIKRLLNFSRKELSNYLEFENQELLRIIGPPDLSSDFWEKLTQCR